MYYHNCYGIRQLYHVVTIPIQLSVIHGHTSKKIHRIIADGGLIELNTVLKHKLHTHIHTYTHNTHTSKKIFLLQLLLNIKVIVYRDAEMRVLAQEDREQRRLKIEEHQERSSTRKSRRIGEN